MGYVWLSLSMQEMLKEALVFIQILFGRIILNGY